MQQKVVRYYTVLLPQLSYIYWLINLALTTKKAAELWKGSKFQSAE